jgi:hypothetical protein
MCHGVVGWNAFEMLSQLAARNDESVDESNGTAMPTIEPGPSLMMPTLAALRAVKFATAPRGKPENPPPPHATASPNPATAPKLVAIR